MDYLGDLNKNFNLYSSVNRLNDMLFNEEIYTYNHTGYSFGHFFNEKFFRKCPFSFGRTSLSDLFYETNLLTVRGYSESLKNVEDRKEALIYLQIDVDMLKYTVEKCKDYSNYYYEKICSLVQDALKVYDYIIGKLGMHDVLLPQKQYRIIIPDNTKVESASKATTKDIATLLYEYLSIYKKEIREKREILKSLANSVEPIIMKKKKVNDPWVHGVLDNLSMILNNFEIRHSNLNKTSRYYNEKLESYTDKDWEEIYDTAYELILDAMLINDYNQTYAGKIEKHKKKSGLS